MDENQNIKNKESNRTYFMYALTFVIILIIATVAITYAYFTVTSTNSFGSSNTASADIECVDLSISNSANLELSYNYPITDELALTSGSITPITVTIKNNCSASKSYTLALTSMYKTSSGSSAYIADSKIRYAVYKSSTKYSGTGYLSSMTKLSTSSQAYSEITGSSSGSLSSMYPSYTKRNVYTVVSSQTLSSGSSVVWKIYLWVDYYEGDSAMYSSSTATHDSSYDNSTEGMYFAAAVSVTVEYD